MCGWAAYLNCVRFPPFGVSVNICKQCIRARSGKAPALQSEEEKQTMKHGCFHIFSSWFLLVSLSEDIIVYCVFKLMPQFGPSGGTNCISNAFAPINFPFIWTIRLRDNGNGYELVGRKGTINVSWLLTIDRHKRNDNINVTPGTTWNTFELHLLWSSSSNSKESKLFKSTKLLTFLSLLLQLLEIYIAHFIIQLI